MKIQRYLALLSDSDQRRCFNNICDGNHSWDRIPILCLVQSPFSLDTNQVQPYATLLLWPKALVLSRGEGWNLFVSWAVLASNPWMSTGDARGVLPGVELVLVSIWLYPIFFLEEYLGHLNLWFGNATLLHFLAFMHGFPISVFYWWKFGNRLALCTNVAILSSGVLHQVQKLNIFLASRTWLWASSLNWDILSFIQAKSSYLKVVQSMCIYQSIRPRRS